MVVNLAQNAVVFIRAKLSKRNALLSLELNLTTGPPGNPHLSQYNGRSRTSGEPDGKLKTIK